MRQITEQDLDRLTEMYAQAIEVGLTVHDREQPDADGDPLRSPVFPWRVVEECWQSLAHAHFDQTSRSTSWRGIRKSAELRNTVVRAWELMKQKTKLTQGDSIFEHRRVVGREAQQIISTRKG